MLIDIYRLSLIVMRIKQPSTCKNKILELETVLTDAHMLQLNRILKHVLNRMFGFRCWQLTRCNVIQARNL